MPNVNPMLHLDEEFMWRWHQIDDDGQPSFISPKTFFSREECQRDYEKAIRRLRRS